MVRNLQQMESNWRSLIRVQVVRLAIQMQIGKMILVTNLLGLLEAGGK